MKPNDDFDMEEHKRSLTVFLQCCSDEELVIFERMSNDSPNPLALQIIASIREDRRSNPDTSLLP